MHRPSATENLQAPLSHHYLDATHITPGVVAIGVERAASRSRRARFTAGSRTRIGSISIRRRWIPTARASRGPTAVGVPALGRRSQDAREQVAVRRDARDGVSVVLQGRRESIDRVAGGVRPEPRGVRQARGLPARSDAAGQEARVLHARRGGGEGHSRCRLSSDRHGAHASPIAGRRVDARLRARFAAPAWGAFGVGGDVTGYLVPETSGNPTARRCHSTSSCAIAARPAHAHQCPEAPFSSAMYSHRSFGVSRFQIVKNG